jgi:hypothetical protein
MARIIAYFIYIIIFTFCYYWLNRRLANKWIIIIYPLTFAAAIFPLKYWFQYARPTYGDAIASSWLKIILMLFGCLIVFNISYAFINFIVSKQVKFHQKYGNANVGFVASFIDKATNIKSLAHFFFYVGGVIFPYIIVTGY